MKRTLFYILSITILLSCSTTKKISAPLKVKDGITSLRFIDEVILPNDTEFKNTLVGGLSGIDYANGEWFVICDDRKKPRFYEFDLEFTRDSFKYARVTNVTFLMNNTDKPFTAGIADPESLRITNTGDILWSSEGNISTKVDPFIRISDSNGAYKNTITLPSRYLAKQNGIRGPRNNGVFESLSQDYKSDDFWTAIELPLEEDGDVPTSTTAMSPVRLAFIDMEKKTFGQEFAYELGKVARKGEIEVNGITEILSYDKNTFLVLERSYSKGYKDGGNSIKIFKATTSGATDVSGISSLSKTAYTPVKKELLLDFDTVRNQLTNGIVDNIEGMSFGPNFPNGNRSLIFVSDNNFNAFGAQITQFLLFEVQ